MSLLRRHRKIEESFSAMETYIEKELTLVFKKEREDVYLEAGTHSYPFQFLLANCLPSSYEHGYGIIRYKIVFEMERIAKIREKLFEKTFTISNTLDLNAYGALKRLNSVRITKTFRNCFCLNSGNLVITLNTLQGGFVPGQVIPFGLVIENNSSKNIKTFYVYLIQQTHVQAKFSLRIVSKFKFPKMIVKKTTEVLRNACINVPAVCETFNQNLIKVNYFLIVSINKRDKKRMNKLNLNYLTVPILIGKNGSSLFVNILLFFLFQKFKVTSPI